jgi:septal ring factor EnvC (AmiA/AmiB activator)
MKINIAVASLLLVGIAQTVPTEMPAWLGQVDTILAGVHGMYDMFIQDTELYANLTGTLETMFSDFDRRDAERKKLFELVRCKINVLNSQVISSANQIAEKNAQIRDLEAEILAIRHDTQAEIDRLNDVINALNIELNATREAYATLVDINEEKAELLISQLSLVKQAYAGMLDSRSSFMATLNHFINRTRVHLAKSGLDMKDLKSQIINIGQTPGCNQGSDNS